MPSQQRHVLTYRWLVTRDTSAPFKGWGFYDKRDAQAYAKLKQQRTRLKHQIMFITDRSQIEFQ